MKKPCTVAPMCLLVVLGFAGRSAAWTWITLDSPSGTVTTPKGVFGNKIVGSCLDAANKTHGFLYDAGAWSTIEPAGSLGSDATAICSGSIVGSYTYLSGGSHGFYMGDAYVYSGGTYTPLHMPGVDGSLSGLHAVPTGTDGVRIVGGLASNDISGFVDQNFVYDGTTWTSLNAAGATSTVLNGISGSKIVGRYRTTTTGVYGFLYDGATQTWSTLRFQPTGERVIPYGIDGDSIVGSYLTSADKQCGFYYDGTTWSSLTYPGAQATYARAISGNNIVGYYTDAVGVQHGFLLTIPEPATISLLALGGLLIARRRP